MRCVVPNCENKLGVPLPEHSETLSVWLKNLEITEETLDADSLVCFDHFNENDFEQVIGPEGSLERQLRSDALPKLFPSKDAIEKETEEFLEFNNQKNVPSHNIPEGDNNINEPEEELQVEQSNGNDAGQGFRGFNDGEDFILVQKENSEYQSSPQLFTTYKAPNSTENTCEEQTLVAQDNEDYLSLEFSQKQIFQSQPAIYTTDNQQVYISVGEQGNNTVSAKEDIEMQCQLPSETNLTNEEAVKETMDDITEPIEQTISLQEGDPTEINIRQKDEFHENEQYERTNLQDGDNSSTIHDGEKEVGISADNDVMQWFIPSDGRMKSEQDVQQNVSSETDICSDPETLVFGIAQNRQEIKITKKEDSSNDKSKEDSCRLCMSKDNVSVNVVDNITDNVMVLEAIQLCIYSLEISLEDPFSKKICLKCFDLLRNYFEFRQTCIRIDADQRKKYEKERPQHNSNETRTKYQRKTHMKTIISPAKTGYRETEIVTVIDQNSKKNCSRKVILTPNLRKKPQSEEIHHLLKDINTDVGPNEKCVRQIISKVSRADDIQVFKLNKSSSHQNSQNCPAAYSTGRKTPAIPISVSPKKLKPSQLEALARKPLLPTEKHMKIQEELKKVIEGKMSKDELSLDHVIVRVVSDDEMETEDQIPVKRKKYNAPVEVKQEFRRMKIGRGEVVIPRGIRVSVPEKFESSKGVFPCFPKIGALGAEFALVDGYLFEYRLCKGRERVLKCLSCPSTALQKQLPNGSFENRAHVKIAHNHYQLTNAEIKKQMFYYIMKKKMQADKGLNFRNIYEHICEKDSEMKVLVPLRHLINEICKHQLTQKTPQIKTFDDFYNIIEDDSMQKYQFTYSGKQFYQEKFTVKNEGTKAVVFANIDTIKRVSHSKLMYVDASFRIDTGDNFSYQLVTVLVWVDDSYYPIMFALVSSGTMEIFKMIFSYLHDTLAPNICPQEIVTDYEANLYYALGETYLESHIGGSVFYYTQNIYKKICELGLSRELETVPYFRNIYHMLLMLPLLPVNTIIDGLHNIEIQAIDLGVGETTAGLFKHIKEQWMEKVSPDLFCVHRLENRINENVIAPFKKLRDFLMLYKGKTQRQTLSIINVVEKLIDLENFLHTTYASDSRKSFGRDLSSSQKKNVLKAWQYIETHPKININHFFTKVIGYIKCMENQLWIWGYYKFSGSATEDLINAANFSIVNTNENVLEMTEEDVVTADEEEENFDCSENIQSTVVVEALVGPSGEFVISDSENCQKSDNPIFKYVYKE